MKNSLVMRCIIDSCRPFKWWLFGQVGVALAWAVDLNFQPYLLKIMIDRVQSAQPEEVVSQLLGPALIYVGLLVFVVIVYRFYDYIWLNVNEPMKRHIGDVLMKKIMCQSQSVLQNHFAGDLGNKIKDVMSGVPDILQIFIDKYMSVFLGVTCAACAAWTIHYSYAFLLISWALIFTFGSALFSKHIHLLSMKAAQTRSIGMGTIVDILSTMMSVRLFSGGQFESKRLYKILTINVEADQRKDWALLKLHFLQALSFIVYQVICLLWLVYGLQDGTVSAGDFALLLSVNLALIDALWSLSKDMGRFTELIGNVEQALKIVLAPCEIQDALGATSLIITKGAIRFDKVQFNYKGSEAIFQNKSIVIPSGEKVGLVGYSGSGKSTFVNLILRFYDVTGGAILIDDQNIRNVTQDSLRNAIGMIPQDPSLFHRTLRENIRYGRPEASDEQVVEAAKRAHAHDFIVKLPQGYESLVGERGVKLSGGQRQRIAIARAILKNAPILILDEATSQLDSITEQEIQASIENLMRNKTTLIVAHRLSTLMQMDRILVFDGGKIVQDGTHHDLLEKGGLYKTLWDAQVGGFLLEPDGEEADEI